VIDYDASWRRRVDEPCTHSVDVASSDEAYTRDEAVCTLQLDTQRDYAHSHGRRKWWYAGDLTPPTIYVEGILICISPPLEKPNT